MRYDIIKENTDGVRQMGIKIMSYNTQHCLNYITKEIDFDLIADTIIRSGADIIGLQEMRGEGPKTDYTAQTQILAEKTGFHFYFAKAIMVGGKNPYGNAILSRYPIISAETVSIPDPKFRKLRIHKYAYESRCLLKAEIDVCGGLNVIVSHFGLNPEEQKNAVKTVVNNLSDSRCVLMGDFNMEPDDKILIPVRNILYDTADKFDCPKLSYPSDKPTVKIDYIFTSKDLNVTSADIPSIVSSDHRPHIAEIEL